MPIVLDTDVASNLIKDTLDTAARAKLAPHEAAITFVTVGELTQWATARDLGTRAPRRVAGVHRGEGEHARWQ